MREIRRLDGLGHVHAEQNAIIVDAAAPTRIHGLAGKGVVAPGCGTDPLLLDPDDVRTVAGGDR